MGRKRSYTDEEFALAVKTSNSIAGVLRKLGLKPTGGNYQVAKRRIKLLELDNSHFTGQAHLKGKTHNWAPKVPLEDILVKDCKWGGTTHHLKNRLIREGYFIRKCYGCELTEWKSNPIPIELEHKNGDRFDNRIENLTILCPNCHALTPTYRGKNKKSHRKIQCKLCSASISKSNKSGLCRKCASQNSAKKRRKVERPPKNQLVEEVKSLGYRGTGRKYGVSDNAVRKWLQSM